MKTLSPLLLLLIAVGAQASGLSYDYVDARYVDTVLDGSDGDADIDLDGYGLRGSFAIAPFAYAIVNYADTSGDIDTGFGNIDLTLEQKTLGLGTHIPMSATTDAVLEAAYEYYEVSSSGLPGTTPGSGSTPVSTTSDIEGYSLKAGLRNLVTHNVELQTHVRYLNVSDRDDRDEEVLLGVGGLYHFDNGVSLGVDTEIAEDYNNYSVFGRFNF